MRTFAQMIVIMLPYVQGHGAIVTRVSVDKSKANSTSTSTMITSNTGLYPNSTPFEVWLEKYPSLSRNSVQPLLQSRDNAKIVKGDEDSEACIWADELSPN